MSVQQNNFYYTLFLKDLSLQVHLGCSSEERKETQEVRVSLELRFFNEPPGATSDELDGTICYAKISDAFSKYVQGREFMLIEKLTKDLFQIVQKIVEKKGAVALTIHKVNPPVPNLFGGSLYRMGEFI